MAQGVMRRSIHRIHICFWMDKIPTAKLKICLLFVCICSSENKVDSIHIIHNEGIDSSSIFPPKILSFILGIYSLHALKAFEALCVLQLQKRSNYQKRWREIIQNAMFVVIGTKYNERFQLQFWQNGVGIPPLLQQFLECNTKL